MFLYLKDGICDVCGSALIKRDDDNEESFKKRYEVFIKNTEPIKAYYEELGKLKIIDANKIRLNHKILCLHLLIFFFLVFHELLHHL